MENAQADNKLVYKHRTELGTKAMSAVLNKYIMGMLCFMASLGASQFGLDLLGLDSNNFNVLMIPLAISSMLFVVLSFQNRDITGGIVLLVMGMSQLTNTVSALAFDAAGFTWQQIFFTAGFAVASYIYYTRKQIDTIPCALLCITILLSSLLNEHGSLVTTVGYWLCGSLYFVSASYRIYRHCVKKEVGDYMLIHMDESKLKYDDMLFNTAGIISFAILSMFLCFYIFDGSTSVTLYIVKLVISSITLIFGLFSITHGFVDEGLLMFSTSLNMFIFSFMFLAGFPEPLFLSILTSMINLFLAFKFLQDRKKYIFALMSMMLFVVFILEFFFTYARYMEVFLLVVRVLSGLIALCSWVEYETGSFPISFISTLRERFFSSNKHVNRGMDMTPYVTSGILLLWMGFNYILYNMNTLFDMSAFLMVSIILSIPPLIFVKSMLKESKISEAMLTFVITTSTLIISVTELIYGEKLPDLTYTMFFMAAIICMITFLKRRNIPMSLASLSLIFSFIMQIVFVNPYTITSGILYIISGTILMSDTFLDVFIGDKLNKHIFRNDVGALVHRSDPVLAIVPFMMYLMSLTCLMFTFEDATAGFCTLNIFLSIILLLSSFYCMMHGDAYSMPVVLMVSVIALTDSFAFIMNAGDSYIIYTPIIIIGLISAPSYLTNGRVALGVTCLLCGILTLIGIMASSWLFVWIGFGILGLISFIYAVNMWLAHDIGIRPLKTFLFRDLYNPSSGYK